MQNNQTQIDTRYYIAQVFYCQQTSAFTRGKLAERLEQLVREVAQENAWEILRLAIQPDHMHPFIRANPSTLPADIARKIKGRSSHMLREEVPSLNTLPSLWTRSTFYSTTGNVSTETIQKYIERQSKT